MFKCYKNSSFLMPRTLEIAFLKYFRGGGLAPRKYSAIFGNFRELLGNVRLAFGTILENLRRSWESGRKSSENRQKRRHHYVYMYIIMFLCKLTSSLRSPVIYCSCHSNTKFISARWHHVISSITNLAWSSRTGEHWPSVGVCTTRASGQYSSVRPSRSVDSKLERAFPASCQTVACN